MQKLYVVKKENFGVYLGESEEAERESRVLLPAKQVPEGCEAGDALRVFIYRDSQDRLIATTREPKILLHGVAVLKCSQVNRIGAFLD